MIFTELRKKLFPLLSDHDFIEVAIWHFMEDENWDGSFTSFCINCGLTEAECAWKQIVYTDQDIVISLVPPHMITEDINQDLAWITKAGFLREYRKGRAKGEFKKRSLKGLIHIKPRPCGRLEL